MAKFSGGLKNDYALYEMARYFGNAVVYYKGGIFDDEYFAPIVALYGNKAVEEEILRTFTPEELVREGACCDDEEREPSNRRSYAVANGRIYFTFSEATDVLQVIWNEKSMKERCREMLLGMARSYQSVHEKKAQKDGLRHRFEELKRFFKLTDLEIEILKFSYVRAMTPFDSEPYRKLRGSGGIVQRLNFYAMAIDRSIAELKSACYSKATLRKYEFIDEDLDICDGVQNYLNGEDDKPLQGRFFRERKNREVLPWDFYDKALQRHGDLIRRLITTKRDGVNILLYGEPGSGKTSFVQTLAQGLGLKVYEVLHGEEDGRNTSLGSRLIGVQVCNEQMPQGSGLLMVDEADQILETGCGGGVLGYFGGRSGGGNASEKGQVNSMLDNIRQPTIWISNASADSMADSVRRRFDYSVCFGKPSHEMRAHVWRNNIQKLRLGRLIREEDIDALASKYETSAGGISMVLRNLKELKPKAKEVAELIRRLMEPHCELMGTKTADDGVMAPARDYSLEGLNVQGEIPLARINQAAEAYYREAEGGAEVPPDRPRMNLLLWGPPGTGKTEYVKYLAKTLGRKVLVKMGSDLLSMWVGGTEQNIKKAFREAEDSGAILFLDEIDGLVQDRMGAHQSWEVTQVNELLHQMENFKGVMVGATNFMDNLDQAIMRRFTFKLQFDYLDEAGKRLFFERMFKTTLSQEDAAALDEVRNLAPGDYRTVRQSMYYLGGSVTNAQRIAALAQESAVKRDSKKAGKIGF